MKRMLSRRSSERFEDSLAACQAFAAPGDVHVTSPSSANRNTVNLSLEDLEPVLPDRPPQQIKITYDKRPSFLSSNSFNESLPSDDRRPSFLSLNSVIETNQVDIDRRPSILSLNSIDENVRFSDWRKSALNSTNRQDSDSSVDEDILSIPENVSVGNDSLAPVCNTSPKQMRSNGNSHTSTQASFLAMRRMRDTLTYSLTDGSTLSTQSMTKFTTPSLNGPFATSKINNDGENNNNNNNNSVQRRAQVLVVDDSKVNRMLLSKYVTRLGHETLTASNGAEALKILMEKLDNVGLTNNNFIDIDLVLLDVYMPELNGDEVLKIMMETEGLQQIPVIMISGSEEMEDVVKCIDMGAVDFLPKPFDPVLFKARMKSCLSAKHFRDRENKYLQQIEKEKQRSDQLLQIIYPEKVAKELKQTRSVRPRRYENVAVMFLDICGFTSYCNGQAPEDIIGFLQQIFNSLEDIAEMHNVEKIKTIGDCFMATAGLLEDNDNPVRSCITSGLAMVEAARNCEQFSCEVRVGIHVGPVVAGVVGRKRSLFDLWGDTVNTASRVESNGVEGGVTVSADAYACIEKECEAISLGEVEVKGKGRMELYQITRLI